MHGNTMIGPNSAPVPGKEERTSTREGMDEIWSGAQKLVPSLNPRFTIALFSGLRATGNAQCETPGVDYNADFIIEIPWEVHGLVNLGGIESPGLTSAPAIAQRVVDCWWMPVKNYTKSGIGIPSAPRARISANFRARNRSN